MRAFPHPIPAFAFVALAAIATAALAADKRESRPVSGFKGVDIAVPGKVEIVQDGTESLTLEGPEDMLAGIETTVRNDGLLLIRPRSRISWGWKKDLNVVIHMKQVESVGVTGSADVHAGRLHAPKLTLSIAGSGDIALWARESLQVKIAGSGDVRYYGDPSIEKRIVGSGSVKRLGPAPT